MAAVTKEAIVMTIQNHQTATMKGSLRYNSPKKAAFPIVVKEQMVCGYLPLNFF